MTSAGRRAVRPRGLGVAGDVEAAQQLHRLVCQQAGPAGERRRRCACPPAGAAARAGNVQHGAAAAKLVVATAVDDATDCERGQRAGAHDAGLARHVQRAPREVQRGGGALPAGKDLVDRLKLSVAGAVAGAVGLVVALPQHSPLLRYDHAANRHLLRVVRRLCLRQCQPHVAHLRVIPCAVVGRACSQLRHRAALASLAGRAVSSPLARRGGGRCPRSPVGAAIGVAVTTPVPCGVRLCSFHQRRRRQCFASSVV
mmetsp:Transcript_1974/g.4883  ORF Transcript_1974/g.4883 Transcript_1974/m.4883 type:complete len:256 (-) Transcript_1974:57-824(-)